MSFPLEHNPKLLGEYAEREKVEKRMAGIVLAVAIGILLLLHACFRSWRLAAIAYLALPAAVAGALLAAFLTSRSISLGSVVGLLAVVGIGARNALLLIEEYQRLQAAGQPLGLELAVHGARDRLLAIIGSGAAITAALLPLALAGQAAGLEIVQPTAIVIIGGLLASSLVTLFAMPLLYLLAAPAAAQADDTDLRLQ